MDDWFGIESPKMPDILEPPKPPSLDVAAETQRLTDRMRFRKGRASTRLGAGALTGKTPGFKLLGGTA
jgi:hypothetical protein